MKVRVTLPVSLTPRQAPLESEFYPVSAYLLSHLIQCPRTPLKLLLYDDYSVNDVSSHKSVEVVLHAFVKDSQLQGCQPGFLHTSTMVEYIGTDHCRLHVFVSQ
jgi:hypothetical protein